MVYVFCLCMESAKIEKFYSFSLKEGPREMKVGVDITRTNNHDNVDEKSS